MRTLVIIFGGLLPPAVFMRLPRLAGDGRARGWRISFVSFGGGWTAPAAASPRGGVTRAGHSFMLELPISRSIVPVPAACGSVPRHLLRHHAVG